MKPGDLVRLRKWNITHRVPITYLVVYHDSEGSPVLDGFGGWKWEHGEWGILLEGRDISEGMVQVLHRGRIGWIEEEHIEAR